MINVRYDKLVFKPESDCLLKITSSDESCCCGSFLVISCGGTIRISYLSTRISYLSTQRCFARTIWAARRRGGFANIYGQGPLEPFCLWQECLVRASLAAPSERPVPDGRRYMAKGNWQEPPWPVQYLLGRSSTSWAAQVSPWPLIK